MGKFQNSYFFLCSVALILGSAGAWLSAAYGSRFGLLDLPTERSSHHRAVPKGGGIGILVTFVLVSLIQSLPLTFWIPAAVVSAFSFWGDRSEILPILRLCVHFAASLIFLYGITTSQPFRITDALLLLSMAILLVGTANFYNFMDGINGIAGITGIIAFGLIAFYAFFLEIDSFFLTLAACMSFSCLGFLPFNMPKAKVFMGDVGSILLGFVFAGMVVLLSKSFLDFVCLSAFLFPFYADELTTMIVRLKEGENLISPHRRHLYQLLANEMGIAHWKVSTGYALLQLAVGVNVLIIRPYGLLIVILLQVCCFAVFGWVSFSIRSRLKNLGSHQE